MVYQKITTQKRLPKFKRKHEPEETPVEIQKRDIEILKLVFQYRFLNADHIRALMNGHNKKAITQRLTKLYRAGYLDRPVEQVSIYYKYGNKGSSPIIYALGQRGAKALAEREENKIDGLDWKRKNQEVKDRTLLHDLGVANFGVILRLAIEAQANDTNLLYWKQDRQDREEIKDRVIVYNKKKKEEETQTIIPDAVFRLQYPKGRPLFFLEHYREILTNNKKYLEQKLLRYAYYYQQERHKKKYDSKNFRVITMVPTKERIKNLIAIIKAEKTLSQLESYRFWFVCMENLDVSKPGSILEPIFRIPTDKEGHGILE